MNSTRASRVSKRPLTGARRGRAARRAAYLGRPARRMPVWYALCRDPLEAAAGSTCQATCAVSDSYGGASIR